MVCFALEPKAASEAIHLCLRQWCHL